MGRKSLKKERQKEIIEAFYKVAKKEGLENTSVAKVAKEIDVNNSLILHYFNSKDELIFGLINYILENYKSLYNPNHSGNSHTKLIKTIDNLFSREWNELIDDGVFYSSFALVFRNKAIKESYKGMHQSLRSYLAAIIKEAQADDIVAIENAEETAELIFILVEGAYYYLSLYDATTEEYEKKVKRYKEAAFTMLKIKEEVR
ncbi:TetR family transcriptional regulator [Zhouia spongiae]|uniref:Biofilm operon icaADBC HTH-type negative transcriptional regulator IcaR n=1 Tax=Zhouia spongiae TaxID=2202721 RepID=A0ABY3YJF6_9FLAO|nr:TetR family transcriptional regulator [Zhouia spongiae]UNY97957.1 TetR family transcriptional regulator [Zhouia spongiae]